MDRVKVDSERCIRCGACVAIAPDIFDYGDEGESVVIKDEVTEEVRQAVDMCPVSAIEIKEDATDNIIEFEPKVVEEPTEEDKAA